jgi:hypothetical protein
MSSNIFWDIMLHSVVEVHHSTELHNVTSKKTAECYLLGYNAVCSLTCQWSAQHTLTHFSCLFPTPAKPPLLRDVSNFCSSLLLVCSVVMRELNGFNLSYAKAIGTEFCSSIPLLLPIKVKGKVVPVLN